jgi:hypothetical protein
MKLATSLTFAALLSSVPSASFAQAPSNAEDFLGLLKALRSALYPPKLVVAQGAPTANSAPSGVGFAAVSGTFKRDGGQGIDGSMAFGAGFGNAATTIGGQVAVNLTSVDPADFADSGTVSVKLSRNLPPSFGNTSFGVSFDNLIPWGDSGRNKVKASAALTIVKQFDPTGSGDTIPVIFNVGASSYSQYHSDLTPFVSVGVGLSQYASVSASYNGDYTSVGMNAKLPELKNISFSASVLDVLDTRNQKRMTFSVSYSLKNLF